MERDSAESLDQPWTRALPARVVREFLICGVFGVIIDTYARRQVTGLEHLDGPAIFVVNHCSHVDTPVLLRSLPARWRRQTAVAAATDYFYANRLLASAVSLSFGTVPLERRARGAGTVVAANVESVLRAGWSLVLFPEGTRSRDGRLGLMRSGAVRLAAELGRPIVPVHISGTHQAMPPGRRWMVRPAGGRPWGRHSIAVSFGPPIHVNPGDDRSAVMGRVRAFMESRGAVSTADPSLAGHHL
jgi:1-acyl-sn-glycerol-3-phosphate acyltransferase